MAQDMKIKHCSTDLKFILHDHDVVHLNAIEFKWNRHTIVDIEERS
jgi:hypothetical protein